MISLSDIWCGRQIGLFFKKTQKTKPSNSAYFVSTPPPPPPSSLRQHACRASPAKQGMPFFPFPTTLGNNKWCTPRDVDHLCLLLWVVILPERWTESDPDALCSTSWPRKRHDSHVIVWKWWFIVCKAKVMGRCVTNAHKSFTAHQSNYWFRMVE